MYVDGTKLQFLHVQHILMYFYSHNSQHSEFCNEPNDIDNAVRSVRVPSTNPEPGLHTLVTSVTVEEELQYANVMIYNGHLYQIAQVRKHLVNNCSCQHINDQQTNDCL